MPALGEATFFLWRAAPIDAFDGFVRAEIWIFGNGKAVQLHPTSIIMHNINIRNCHSHRTTTETFVSEPATTLSTSISQYKNPVPNPPGQLKMNKGIPHLRKSRCVGR